MVLLTMTPGIVRAVAAAEQRWPDNFETLQQAPNPRLAHAQPGNPISHNQLIGLAGLLKHHADGLQRTHDGSPVPTTLDALLRNTTIYHPAPPPKKPQSPEYLALMARLRAEQEALSYERMLHPPPTRENFSQRFPRAPEPFSLGSAQTIEEDDVSYEEVHRQIILIINILVSVVAVGIFVWIAARYWTVGKRLGLALGSALAIAVAEVAVYAGYVRKVQEAKRAERRKPEIKEIVKSWVLDKDENRHDTEKDKEAEGVRYRKGKHR
ncbi:hypothetical protein ACN47E_003698 [Coniothyrium glycines]